MVALSRIKLQVKASCQSLTTSLCLRAVGLATLPSPRIFFFFLSFFKGPLEVSLCLSFFFFLIFLSFFFFFLITKRFKDTITLWDFLLEKSPPVCPGLSDVASVQGAPLHSPGAAETSGSRSVPFSRRAKMSRFKANLFVCNRLHYRLLPTEWTTEAQGERLRQPIYFFNWCPAGWRGA